MNKLLTALLLVVVASSSLSAIPAVGVETKTPPVQLAQYGPVYHAVNDAGVWFWGGSIQSVMIECESLTPYGQYCYYRGFW